MKMKKISISFMALFAAFCSVYAESRLSADNLELPQNGTADLAITYHFEEEGVYSGYQFDITLPDGVQFVTDSEGYVAYVLGSCYKGAPTMTINMDNGVLKVGCFTANTTPITGTDGVLLTFQVKSNGSIAVNETLTATLTGVRLSTEGGTSVPLASSSFNITISEPLDGRVVLDETSTTAPEDATDVDVRVRRTINAGNWSTICLPFAMTNEQAKQAFGNDVQLADFTGCDVETDDEENITSIKVKFQDVTSIEANHPYIIKVSNPITEFTVDGVDIVAENELSVDMDKLTQKIGKITVTVYNRFVGTYAVTTVPNLSLFLNGNKFWYSTGNITIKGFRGYFDFYDVLSDVEEQYAESRISFTVFGNETTGITDDCREATTDNHYYDLQGRQVSVEPGSTRKGLYIKNGEKVFLKGK